MLSCCVPFPPKDTVVQRSEPRGCCSSAFFLWVLPTAIKGYSTPIEEQDVPELTPFLSSDVVERAEKLWADQVDNAASGHGRVSVWSVIWSMEWPRISLAVMLSLVQGLVSCVVRPLLLRTIVLTISTPDQFDPIRALILLVIFFCAIFGEGFLQASVKQIFGNTVCTRGFAWLSTLIFQKSSRIYPGATSIQDTTLVGTDLVAMFQEGGWAAMSFMTLSALAGGITVLISLIGAWSLIGLTVLILMLCITVTIARVGRRFMSRQLKESDNRLSITKEVIAGIKPIKMQGWEYEMHKSVSTARSKETSYLRLFRLCMVVNMSLGRASPILGTCSTFVVMAAFGVEMTLANVSRKCFLASFD